MCVYGLQEARIGCLNVSRDVYITNSKYILITGSANDNGLRHLTVFGSISSKNIAAGVIRLIKKK